MIHIYGTSHISEDSLDLIEEKIDEHEPEIVAIELDHLRLNALVSGKEVTGGPLFLRIVKKFQDYLGSKTGVMPGEEMLYAYRIAARKNIDIALIDQDIRITIQKIKEAPRKEKVKAVLEAALGAVVPGKIDISKIPDEELIRELLVELEKRYPNLHRILVEERDHIMTENLQRLQEENPDAEIVAFVGAAHRKSMEKLLAQYSSENF